MGRLRDLGRNNDDEISRKKAQKAQKRILYVPFVPFCGCIFLERAVISFHLRACGFHLGLANIYERWSCLWVVGELLPFCAPGSHSRPKLCASGFGNFGGDAVFISGEKGIALGDSNLNRCSSVVVSVCGWRDR